MALFSCSHLSSQESIRTDLLSRIANDSDYVKMQQIIDDGAVLVAQNAYDLEGISKIMWQLGGEDNAFCNAPEELLKPVKGAILFRDQNCQLRSLQDKVLLKFSEYRNLSKAEHSSLLELYKSKAPYNNVQRITKALNDLKNKKP